MELVGEKEYVIDGVVIDKQGFQLLPATLQVCYCTFSRQIALESWLASSHGFSRDSRDVRVSFSQLLYPLCYIFLLLFSDHGVYKLFLIMTNIFIVVTCIFNSSLKMFLEKIFVVSFYHKIDFTLNNLLLMTLLMNTIKVLSKFKRDHIHLPLLKCPIYSTRFR